MLKLIDEVLEYLCSKMSAKGWVELDEVTEIMQRQGLTKSEAENILKFLKKYFIEVEESRQKVKLNTWTCDLFEIPRI